MAYQYSKDRTLPAREFSEENPYAVLLANLSGTTITKPRKPHSFDLWAADHQDVFMPALQAAIAEQQPTRFQLAGLRTRIKKAEFDKLPQEAKAEWHAKANEKHSKAMEVWKTSMNSGPSTAPEDHQQYVNTSIISRTTA
jgi:hypothetical protein